MAALGPVAPRRRMPRTKLISAVQIPSDFVINEVPFQPGVAPPAPADIASALGPLKAFTGTFIGRGFNTIFRPQSSATVTSPIQRPPHRFTSNPDCG
jgi:hypothetical protein